MKWKYTVAKGRSKKQCEEKIDKQQGRDVESIAFIEFDGITIQFVESIFTNIDNIYIYKANSVKNWMTSSEKCSKRLPQSEVK
jgi:hypothetical protein